MMIFAEFAICVDSIIAKVAISTRTAQCASRTQAIVISTEAFLAHHRSLQGKFQPADLVACYEHPDSNYYLGYIHSTSRISLVCTYLLIRRILAR